MKIPQSATLSKYTALPLLIFGFLLFGIPSPQHTEVSAQTPPERPTRSEETREDPVNEDGEIESGTETTTETGDTPASLQNPGAPQGSEPINENTDDSREGGEESAVGEEVEEIDNGSEEDQGGETSNVTEPPAEEGLDSEETNDVVPPVTEPPAEEERNESTQNSGNSDTSNTGNVDNAEGDTGNTEVEETGNQNTGNTGGGNTDQEDQTPQDETPQNTDETPENTDEDSGPTTPSVPVIPGGSFVRPDPENDDEDDSDEDRPEDDAEENNETEEELAETTPPRDLYDVLEDLANGLEGISGGTRNGEALPGAENNEIPENDMAGATEEGASSDTQDPQTTGETAEDPQTSAAESDPIEAIGAVAAGTINPLLDLVNTTVSDDEYGSQDLSFAATVIAYTAGFIFLLLGILFSSLEALAQRMPQRAPFLYSQIKQSFSFRLGFETNGLKQGFSSIGRIATRLFF